MVRNHFYDVRTSYYVGTVYSLHSALKENTIFHRHWTTIKKYCAIVPFRQFNQAFVTAARIRSVRHPK